MERKMAGKKVAMQMRFYAPRENEKRTVDNRVKRRFSDKRKRTLSRFFKQNKMEV